MKKQLLPYIENRFPVLDQARLRVAARELIEVLPATLVGDEYDIKAEVVPAIKSVLQGTFLQPLKNYRQLKPISWSIDDENGEIDPQYEVPLLRRQLGLFALTASAEPMWNNIETVMIDGVPHKWFYVEDEGEHRVLPRESLDCNNRPTIFACREALQSHDLDPDRSQENRFWTPNRADRQVIGIDVAHDVLAADAGGATREDFVDILDCHAVAASQR